MLRFSVSVPHAPFQDGRSATAPAANRPDVQPCFRLPTDSGPEGRRTVDIVSGLQIARRRPRGGRWDRCPQPRVRMRGCAASVALVVGGWGVTGYPGYGSDVGYRLPLTEQDANDLEIS